MRIKKIKKNSITFQTDDNNKKQISPSKRLPLKIKNEIRKPKPTEKKKNDQQKKMVATNENAGFSTKKYIKLTNEDPEPAPTNMLSSRLATNFDKKELIHTKKTRKKIILSKNILIFSPKIFHHRLSSMQNLFRTFFIILSSF